MNIYDVAYKIGIFSFVAILAFLICMNLIFMETAVEMEESKLVQGVSIFLTLTVSGSGIFLWFTGFRRFKDVVGTYDFGWLMYATFTVFSGFYMQFRYGSETNI